MSARRRWCAGRGAHRVGVVHARERVRGGRERKGQLRRARCRVRRARVAAAAALALAGGRHRGDRPPAPAALLLLLLVQRRRRARRPLLRAPGQPRGGAARQLLRGCARGGPARRRPAAAQHFRPLGIQPHSAHAHMLHIDLLAMPPARLACLCRCKHQTRSSCSCCHMHIEPAQDGLLTCRAARLGGVPCSAARPLRRTLPAPARPARRAG